MTRTEPIRRRSRHAVAHLLVLVTLLALAALPAAGEGPPRLDVPAVALSGHFEAESSQAVYESIAEQAGLSLTFDPDLRHRPVSLDIAGLGVGEALNQVALLAGHYVAPVSARSVLVMPDTPQNRRRSESIGIRSFSLQHAEVKDVMTALRSLIDARRLTATEDPPRITLRDTYPKLAVGSRVVEMLDRQPWVVDLRVELLPVPPEVVIEVARSGGELSAERERAVRARAGAPLAVGTLGLVGAREAEWRVSSYAGETAGGEAGDRMVSLSARGRLSEGDRPLRLDVDLSVLSPGATRDQGLRQRSTFQVSQGTTLALPVLHRGDGDREAAASALLLLTPTVVEPGRLDPQAVETLYVGTEAAIQVAAEE